MLGSRLKFTNELHYVETDRTGKSEQDFEVLKIKGIWLTPGQPFGIKAKYALLCRFPGWQLIING